MNEVARLTALLDAAKAELKRAEINIRYLDAALQSLMKDLSVEELTSNIFCMNAIYRRAMEGINLTRCEDINEDKDD